MFRDRRDRPSQRSGFGEDSLSQIGTKAAVRQHFHTSSEQLLEILFERDYVEEASARFDVNEQIDIAVRMNISPRRRTEHPYVARTVARGEREHFSAMPPKRLKSHRFQ